MIIKLKKLLIYGLEKEISIFFEKSQIEGYIEFVGTSSKKMKEMPSSLKNYVDAIKILKMQPAIKVKDEKLTYSPEVVCEKIIQVSNNVEHLEELKIHFLNQLSVVAPLGDFSLTELEFIRNETNHTFQFFTIKSSTRIKKGAVPEDLIYLATEYDLDYFVALNKEKKSYPGYVELKIDMPFSVLKKRIEMIDEQLENQKNKLKSYAIYLPALKERLMERINIFNLEIAKNETKKDLDEKLFSIEAWLPINKMADFEKFVSQFAIDWSLISLEEKDVEPTCIDNKNLGKIGEDLIKIYDIPSTQDKDPSLWVFWFFSLFFAMIVGDGGYGLVYLFLGFFLRFKFKNPRPNMKRFINLVFILSSSCILWGLFTTSFFGINFKPDNPIQKVSIIKYLCVKKADFHLVQKDDVYKEWLSKYPDISKAKDGNDFLLKTMKKENKSVSFEALDAFYKNVLMEFSLIFGTVHILLSFLRNLRRNFAGIGWSFFMIGGYLYFPSILKATSMINFLNILPKQTAYFYGFHILFMGIILAIILAFIQKRIGGIGEVTNVVGVFGDVLSYLRLYALAIAGMILSQTFNQMAMSVNILIGILIVIIGHLMNMVLGIMGGIIHGLRLNFLEWYNHCFEGGGKIFNPLKIIK